MAQATKIDYVSEESVWKEDVVECYRLLIKQERKDAGHEEQRDISVVLEKRIDVREY